MKSSPSYEAAKVLYSSIRSPAFLARRLRWSTIAKLTHARSRFEHCHAFVDMNERGPRVGFANMSRTRQINSIRATRDKRYVSFVSPDRLIDYSSDPQGLLDSCKSLPNRSYPFWRIVCGTTEIGPAESLFLASQKHHDGNTR